MYALRGADLTINPGEFVSLAGPSGSGKSTLLNVIGGLDGFDAGSVVVGGVDLGGLNAAELAEMRLRNVGFVFQAYNLIPVLTARENVEFILQLQGTPNRERRERADTALQRLGLGDLGDRRPGELSGGQQQRVAIARAIVTEPVLLLADEPTANLDSKTTEELLGLLRDLNQQQGMTIVTATHDPIVIAIHRARSPCWMAKFIKTAPPRYNVYESWRRVNAACAERSFAAGRTSGGDR